MSVIDTFTIWELLRYLYYIYMVVAVVVAVSVVLNNRIPVKTIAWVCWACDVRSIGARKTTG